MKRVVLLLTVALAGCGGTTETATTTAPSAVATVASAELVAPGELHACTAVPTKPFAFRRDGALDGLEVELVMDVAQRLDLDLSWRVLPRRGLEPALLAGRCDVVAARLRVTYAAQVKKAMLAYLRIEHGDAHEHIGLALPRLHNSLWFGVRGAIIDMQQDRTEQRLIARWRVPNAEALTLN